MSYDKHSVLACAWLNYSIIVQYIAAGTFFYANAGNNDILFLKCFGF